ncbi:hypothetical protein CKAH01_01500 [Colletotrichum kahawae]|uniref:Uncharacterized protein n=1 Tax=Colletotrichum kahawae TaxID=34407 RepID=A0AAE0D1T8_COLKA|nr:hypothetical protein CKAH01_01500 [Colletotrichum kahawae]
MLAHERRVVGSFAGAWRRQGNVDHVWWRRQPEGVSQRCMEHAPIGEWAWILVSIAVELVTLYLVHGRCNLPTLIGRAHGINGLTKLRALGLDLLGLPSFRALHHWACCSSIGSNRPRRLAFRLALVFQTNGSPPSFGAGTGGIDGTDDMRNKSNDGPLSPPFRISSGYFEDSAVCTYSWGRFQAVSGSSFSFLAPRPSSSGARARLRSRKWDGMGTRPGGGRVPGVKGRARTGQCGCGYGTPADGGGSRYSCQKRQTTIAIVVNVFRVTHG